MNDKTTTTQCSECGHHKVRHDRSGYEATKEDAERFADAKREQGSDGWQLMADFATAVSGVSGEYSGYCQHCGCLEFSEAQPEFSCPRRLENQPSMPAELSDYWFENRWGRLKGDYFPDDTKPPRTCSYCGGINPQDAITLISQGWEVEPTTKRFKRYLHPKGYTAYIQELINRIPRAPEAAAVQSPIPPVKVYVQHFSVDQINEFNSLINRLRKEEK